MSLASSLRGLATGTAVVVAWLPLCAFAQQETPAAPAVEATPAEPAQEAAPAEQPAAVEPVAEQPAAPKAGIEEIVITGSRIRRTDLATPAPVTVLDKSQMENLGRVSIGDILQTLPSQVGGTNTSVNNGGDGSTRIDLRGLGSARTLTLLNGRRFVPSGGGADDSVDMNSIPGAAIERVEVLKDGASAVYGSDAIAGVVNLITRRNWTGTEASAWGGISSRGDGSVYDLNVTTGIGTEKGSFLFSAGYYRAGDAMAGDREFSRVPRLMYSYDDDGDGKFDGANDEFEVVDSAGSGTSKYGRIIIPALARGEDVPNPTSDPRIALYNSLHASCQYANDMTPDPTKPVATDPTKQLVMANRCPASYILDEDKTTWRVWEGLPIKGEFGATAGDGYNFQPDNFLVTPQQRFQLFTLSETKIGPARLYFEGSYVNRRSEQLLAAEPLNLDVEGVTVSANSAYNPFGIDVGSGYAFRRRLIETGGRSTKQDIDTFRVVAGLDGSLDDDFGVLAGWFWDVNGHFGRTLSASLKSGNMRLTKLADALGPSFIDANGDAHCGAVGATIDGCVPLNIFAAPGDITQEQLGGLTYVGASRGFNQLAGAAANVTGELFAIADKPAALAMGYEFRHMSGGYRPDPITAAGETSGNKSTPTEGSYYVNEGYAELSLPIVSGVTGIEALELTAAMRAFNYSTSAGGGLTYKAGLRWTIIPELTVRGTYSTAFRAPSIADLYAGGQDSFEGVSDPCRNNDGGMNVGDRPNCAAENAAANGDTNNQLLTRYGGNVDLKPETAVILTAGLVAQPIEDLSITADFYTITMDKTISSLGAPTILQGCYPVVSVEGQAPAKTPKYCEFIQRDPVTRYVTTIESYNQNVGDLATSGIDLGARYAMPTDFGRFSFNVDATWLNEFNRTLGDGTVVKAKNTFDLGSLPDLRMQGQIGWAYEGLNVQLMGQFINSFEECAADFGGGYYEYSGYGLCYEYEAAGIDRVSRTVDAYFKMDAAVGYALQSEAGTTSLTVGVSNLLDTAPSEIFNGFLAASDPRTYDYMGRYFWARLTQAF